jgi:hypothetical protein
LLLLFEIGNLLNIPGSDIVAFIKKNIVNIYKNISIIINDTFNFFIIYDEEKTRINTIGTDIDINVNKVDLKVVGPKRYNPLNTKKLSPSHLEIY